MNKSNFLIITLLVSLGSTLTACNSGSGTNISRDTEDSQLKTLEAKTTPQYFSGIRYSERNIIIVNNQAYYQSTGVNSAQKDTIFPFDGINNEYYMSNFSPIVPGWFIKSEIKYVFRYMQYIKNFVAEHFDKPENRELEHQEKKKQAKKLINTMYTTMPLELLKNNFIGKMTLDKDGELFVQSLFDAANSINQCKNLKISGDKYMFDQKLECLLTTKELGSAGSGSLNPVANIFARFATLDNMIISYRFGNGYWKNKPQNKTELIIHNALITWMESKQIQQNYFINNPQSLPVYNNINEVNKYLEVNGAILQLNDFKQYEFNRLMTEEEIQKYMK